LTTGLTSPRKKRHRQISSQRISRLIQNVSSPQTKTKPKKRANPFADEIEIAHRRAVDKADEKLSSDPSAKRLIMALKRWLGFLKQRFANQKPDWSKAADDLELLGALDSVSATGWLPLLDAHLRNSSLTRRWREILPSRAIGKALGQLTAQRLDVEVFPFVS
jgi:hypothetical protein